MPNNDNIERLSFSPEAKDIKFLFYHGLNDFNLFVEDTHDEYLYETLIKRLLEGYKYNLNDIFPLGGKQGVIKHYMQYGAEQDGIKNFYIVDGDFDRYIKSENMINDKCFLYLHAYNIENYFIDEEACLKFVKGKWQLRDSEVKRKLNFNFWRTKITDQAKKLFLCYCSIQKYNPEIVNVSRGPYAFIDNTGFERESAFDDYYNQILEKDPQIDIHMSEIESIYEQVYGTDYFYFICGKFLLTSLSCYIKSIKRKPFENEDFKWFLVNNFDITKLNYVRNALVSYVGKIST